jgi:hypothetical protein
VLWAKVVPNMALTEPVAVDGMSCGGEWFEAWRGPRVHTPPEAEDLVPVRMTIPLSVIVMAVLVKMAEQPWSQNWPMERSELE